MTNNEPFRLWGSLISANCRRVALTFNYLGVPYNLVPVDLRSQADRAKLRQLNPNEKIPVLEHGSFVLWESHAIMQYVADLALAATVSSALQYRAPFDPYAHIRTHLDRVRALPAWKTTEPS